MNTNINCKFRANRLLLKIDKNEPILVQQESEVTAIYGKLWSESCT